MKVLTISPPYATTVVVTPHPQGPHGLNNIHYDAANAATPERPVGAAKGESDVPLGLYKYPESQKWFTVAVLSAVGFLVVVFVVYRKIARRREVKRQLKEEGEVKEIRWDRDTDR